MKNMYIRKNSGITLIALVITIIILMILVGVTISMVFNGGILEKANMSAEQYSINQAKEELELAIANLQMEEIRRGDVFTKEDLTKLNNDVISVGSTESFPIEIVYGKYKFKINELFKATYAGEAEGTIVTYTTNPKGYTNADEVHVLLNIENPRGIKEVMYPDDDDSLQCNGRTEVTVDYKVNSNGTYKFKVISSDNKEVTKEVVIDTIDRLAPQSFSITGETTRTGVKINGEAIDSPADGENICSGIDKYEYYVKRSGVNEQYTKYEVNPITGLAQGTYTVYAIAYDMAGNASEPTETIEVEAPEPWTEIYTEEDLRNMAKDLTKNYILMADIELEQTWTPIGNNSYYPFIGELEGNNHKITGLENGTTTEEYQGLFGYIYGASISNLQLEGKITGSSYVGMLVGNNVDGIITNVHVKGEVTGTGNYGYSYSNGGLVGKNERGTITQSSAEVTVIGNIDCVGGLVGQNSKGTIANSYATGDVTGYGSTGGLVGDNSGSIMQSYATGNVTGSVIGNGKRVGGLAGSNSRSITQVYATGTVTGCDDVGGLVGGNLGAEGTITQAYATGTVTGRDNIGGLAGYSEAPITQSYAIGTVTGDSDAGGLVGSGNGTIITDSYWTSEKAGITTSAAGTELTLEQMKTQASYIDWDFDTVWIMREFPEFIKGAGVPRLTATNSCIITEGEWYDGASSYWSPTGILCKYYAFDKELNTYAGTPSNNLDAIGDSIGYDFGKPVIVYRASGKIRMLGYKIQASNDNENWEDIVVATSPGSDNGDVFSNKITTSEKYRYWRLYINGGQQAYNWRSSSI